MSRSSASRLIAASARGLELRKHVGPDSQRSSEGVSLASAWMRYRADHVTQILRGPSGVSTIAPSLLQPSETRLLH